MPEEFNKILKYSQDEKCLKSPFIIYLDRESLLKKIQVYDNSLQGSFTSKGKKHAACSFSVFTHCPFNKK